MTPNCYESFSRLELKKYISNKWQYLYYYQPVSCLLPWDYVIFQASENYNIGSLIYRSFENIAYYQKSYFRPFFLMWFSQICGFLCGMKAKTSRKWEIIAYRKQLNRCPKTRSPNVKIALLSDVIYIGQHLIIPI